MSDAADFTLRLLDKLSGPAGKMSGALHKVEGDLEKVGQAGEKSGGMLRGAFAHALGGLIQEAAHKVWDMTTALGGAVIGAADFSQRATLGFQAVAKHGASAEKLFMHARTLAEGLGLDVFDTSKQFTKFLALQFDPKMATDLIKMGADMRVFGATTEETSRIFAQLGQIQAKGKLQGEELVVLAENGLSTQLVYEHLQKQLGKTKDEILKMQQAGKLTSDMAFPAIMAAVMQKTGEKQLGDVGKRVADQTMSGIKGKLEAQWQNLLIDLGKQATPALSGALSAIGDELSAVMKNPAVKEGIIVAMEKIGNLVRDAVPFIKTFIGSLLGGFQKAWPAIEKATGALFDGFGGSQDWMNTVERFATILGEVIAFGVGVATVFGGMVAAGVQIVTGAVQIGIYMWEGLINGIGAALFAVDDFFANLAAKWKAFNFAELALSMIDGLVNGIRSGITRVVGAVGELGSATLASLKGVLGIHSPSTEFAWLGEMSGEGFNQGLENSLDSAGPRVGSMTNGLGQKGAGLASGGGAPSINLGGLVVHVTTSGADGKKIGQEIGDELEPRLTSLFERFNLSAA